MIEELIKLIEESYYCDIVSLAEDLVSKGVTLQKWIPVTERLPEKWVDVLSCDVNGNITVDCVDNKGTWYSAYMYAEDVTHWMPLPEPPKGEQ